MITPCARSVQASCSSCLRRTQAFLGPRGRQSNLARTVRSRAYNSHTSQSSLRRSSVLRKLLQGSSILLAAGSFQPSFVSMSAAAESKAAQASSRDLTCIKAYVFAHHNHQQGFPTPTCKLICRHTVLWQKVAYKDFHICCLPPLQNNSAAIEELTLP